MSDLGVNDKKTYKVPGTDQYWAFNVNWPQGDNVNKRAGDAPNFTPDYKAYSENKWSEVYWQDKYKYIYNSIIGDAQKPYAESILLQNATKGLKTFFTTFTSANWGDHVLAPPEAPYVTADPITPWDYAYRINPKLLKEIVPEGSSTFTGLMAMDFVSENNQLPKAVYETNFHRSRITFERLSGTQIKITAKPILKGGTEQVFIKDIQTSDMEFPTCEKDGYIDTYIDLSDVPGITQDRMEYHQFIPKLNHSLVWENVVKDGQYDHTIFYCSRDNCSKYSKEKNYTCAPYLIDDDRNDIVYDGKTHPIGISGSINELMRSMVKPVVIQKSESGDSSEDVVVDGLRNVGTYTAQIIGVNEEPLPVDYDLWTYSVAKRPVTVKALDQTVEIEDQIQIKQGTDYAQLLAADGYPLLEGDRIRSVDLTIDYDDDGNTFVRPRLAVIEDADGNDVTANYDIRYEWGNLHEIEGNPVEELPTTGYMVYNGGQQLLVTNGVIKDSYAGRYHFEYRMADDPDSEWSVDNMLTGEDAGTYNVQYRIVSNDTNEALEAIAPQTIEAVIEKRAAVLYWNDMFEYNGEEVKPTATVANAVPGDELNVEVRLGGFYNSMEQMNSHKNVGSYAASVVQITGPGAENYFVPDNDKYQTVTVTPKHVSIEGQIAKDKVYDGTTEAEADLTQAVFPEMVEGDSLTLDAADIAFEDENAGTDKNVILSNVVLGGESERNYVYDAMIGDHVTGNITPKPVGIDWTNTIFYYDGKAHTPTADPDNAVPGDDVDIQISGSGTETGIYQVESVALTGADASNYVLTDDANKYFLIKEAEDIFEAEVVLADGAPKVESENLKEVAEGMIDDDDRAAMSEEDPVRITLEITPLKKADVPAEDNSSLEKYAADKDLTEGQYLDISLWKQVLDERTKITNVQEPIKFTVEVPESLQKDGRTYYLLRCHDGVSEIAAEGSDPVLAAESDRFSTYLIAYQDEEIKPIPTVTPKDDGKSETADGSKSSTSGDGKSGSSKGSTQGKSTNSKNVVGPGTGDSTPVAGYAIAIIASLCCALIITRRYKKQK